MKSLFLRHGVRRIDGRSLARRTAESVGDHDHDHDHDHEYMVPDMVPDTVPDMVPGSRVLVLSVHSPHLDRRIVHQMNALAAAGRTVTLVSVPTHVPQEILDPRIEVIEEAFPNPALETKGPAVEVQSPVVATLPVLKPSTPAWVLRLGRRWFSGKYARPVYRAAVWFRWSLIPSVVCAWQLVVQWVQFAAQWLRQFPPQFWERWIAEPCRRRWPNTVDPQLLQLFVSGTPRRDYAAIHCHDLPTLPVAATLRRMFFPKAKLIYDAHELYPYQLPDEAFERRWKRVERKWIRKTDAVITVNPSIADFLAREHRIRPPLVLYNSHAGADAASPVTRREYLQLFGIEEGGFDVLFQGSLTDDRNLRQLVQGFALLEKDYRLLIIGSGPVEGELRAMAQGMNNVFFGGWLEQHRLLGYTRHAACGVVPYQPLSLNHRFCTPNKLFEFLEARLPVCASDLPELRRFVEQGRAGAVYDLSRPENIAHALRDFRRRVQGGEFSADRFRQADTVYGWPAQEKRLLELYRKLVV